MRNDHDAALWSIAGSLLSIAVALWLMFLVLSESLDDLSFRLRLIAASLRRQAPAPDLDGYDALGRLARLQVRPASPANGHKPTGNGPVKESEGEAHTI